jgi:hypothetical protein
VEHWSLWWNIAVDVVDWLAVELVNASHSLWPRTNWRRNLGKNWAAIVEEKKEWREWEGAAKADGKTVKNYLLKIVPKCSTFFNGKFVQNNG